MNSQRGIKIQSKCDEFPSIRLDKENLEKIIDIVDEEHKALTNSTFVIVLVEKNKSVYAFTDKDDFLHDIDLRNFLEISIKLDYGRKNTSIEIWNLGNKKSTYCVISDDDHWWRDVRLHIQDVLEKFRTRKDFVYSAKAWIVWVAIGIFITLSYQLFLPSKIPWILIFNVSALLFSMTYWVSTFFRWLFPRIELPGMPQIRFRCWILGTVITGIIISVIVELILSVIHT
jgi:hypothetical protein